MTQYTRTNNGAIQYRSSFSNLVDFFRIAGSSKLMSSNDVKSTIEELFIAAFHEDKEIAFKLLFWLRDPRNGAGVKISAKLIYALLNKVCPRFIEDNVENIINYGSWKDILELMDNNDRVITYWDDAESSLNIKILDYWSTKILARDRLACKWAPRLHSKYHFVATKLRDKLNFSNKQYRNFLKENSNTVEQLITKNNWADVNYSTVPSIAMKLYNNAFNYHDEERFKAWKNNSEVKANSSVLYPHDIVKMIPIDSELADKLWKNLPNFIKENVSFLPLIDVSDSMNYPEINGVYPMLISLSLGLYLAERNSSAYKNLFITFSEIPRLNNISGNTLSEKISNLSMSEWGYNTNFELAYELILKYAIDNKLSDKELPSMLIVLSDMEFDQASNFDFHLTNIKNRFSSYDYTIPELVFWNLKPRSNSGSPATVSEKGVSLVSGFSPSLMKSLLNCEDMNPMSILLNTVKDYKVDMTHVPIDFYDRTSEIGFD